MSWLWKQYQIWRGYTPPTEDEESIKYRTQLEDIAEAEASITKDLEQANQTLVQLRKKEKKLTKQFNRSTATLEFFSREDVHLTEEQKTTKIQIERVIEEELKPIVEQTKQKVAHLELMVQTLQDKRDDIRKKYATMEAYLSNSDGQYPLQDINVVEDGDEPVPKEAGVEVYNAQGTPVIQMTDAALLDNDYLTPQRVMADPV